MGNLWQKDYKNLKDFVGKNPSIEITPELTILPGDVRPEFYRLFDLARTSFVKENLAEELGKGYVFSKNWREIQQDVSETLNLESITLPAGSKWFFDDPLNGLIQVLFDPLFDLLKNKTTVTIFERTAAQLVRDDFKKFFRMGYRSWAIMALIKLLLPDSIYNVPAKDFNDNTVSGGDYNPGVHEVTVPEAVPTRIISFQHDLMCSFLVPNMIVHSTKLGCFVSLREDYYEAQWKARFPSLKQEWLSVKDIKKEFGIHNLWPDIVINMADDIADLVLTADYFMIAKPDVTVDFKEDANWFQKEELDSIKRHYHVLNPRFGSFVVHREPVPEAALKEWYVEDTGDSTKSEPTANQGQDNAKQAVIPDHVSDIAGVTEGNKPDIHLLNSDFDVSNLELIIDEMQGGWQGLISKSTANQSNS